jgi:hypothetical protein
MQTVSEIISTVKPKTYQLKLWKFGCLGNTTEPLLSTAIGKLQEQAKC